MKLREWLRAQLTQGLIQTSSLISDMSRLADTVEQLRNQLTQFRADVIHRLMVPSPIGTLLLLWKDDGAPRCASRTIRFRSSEGTTVEYEQGLQFNYPIPAGAWLVAHGCDLRSVYVGVVAEDLGPAPRGKLVCLREPIALGQLLSVSVVPER